MFDPKTGRLEAHLPDSSSLILKNHPCKNVLQATENGKHMTEPLIPAFACPHYPIYQKYPARDQFRARGLLSIPHVCRHILTHYIF